MSTSTLTKINTLTFDVFGTILDLSSGIVPTVENFLENRQAKISGAQFWQLWRSRQRIEQYQDTIVMLGHSGYLEVARRALLYTLRQQQLTVEPEETLKLMRTFEQLKPFDDAVLGLNRLAKRFQLVALSNGNTSLVEHLVSNNIPVHFEAALSADAVGRFKPHPSVYRYAAKTLNREPDQIMMVASHAFDVMGARACGFRGAYIQRYELPYEESSLRPDLTVSNFIELADELLQ
ncbi:MAG: haloacid dehalogenase type II [Solibacterales bacterium]|nr:haloacid dehalogenase type II [Bryobacterales bacterium]|tara:strand:+ start:2817 stop:3521 length:705 start_codon:yes stop_codon:yes gene_type:complete